MRNQSHSHRKVHTLQDIIPSNYIANPQEMVIATALKAWLLSIPDPLRKGALQRIVNPTVFKVHPTDVHMDASIMRASINFPELVEITTGAVEAARQQMEEMKIITEADGFYTLLADYCDTVNVKAVLQNAGDGFMEFLCDCYLTGK